MTFTETLIPTRVTCDGAHNAASRYSAQASVPHLGQQPFHIHLCVRKSLATGKQVRHPGHQTFSGSAVTAVFRGFSLIGRGCFRAIPFDSGAGIEDRERASQSWIAHDRFAAPGALLNAVTLLAVRVGMGDLKVV